MEVDKPKKRTDLKSVFRVYWQEVQHHPWLLFGVIGAGIAVQGADLAAPLFLRQFFNTLTLHAPSSAVVPSLLMTLAWIAAMWLLDWGFNRVQSICNEELEAQVMERLFKHAFSYLIEHSYNFFISNFTGSITHKVSKFARSFETLFDSIMTQFFPTFLFVVGAIVVLYIRNHPLGLILAFCAIGLLAFQIYISRLRQPVRAKRAEAETKLTGALADAVSNQNTIALFSGNLHEAGLFGAAVGYWREMTLRSWKTDSWVWAGLNFFMVAIQVVLLWGAVIYWEQGLLTIGDFVLIQAYLLTTFSRMSGINFQLRRFYDAYADAGEMIEILELPHEVADLPGAGALTVTKGEIEFKDVRFAFNETREVLDHFNLTVASGEKVALVGPSGAGKSTLTKLLLRFYDVLEGQILIDGQSIDHVTQESLRNAIAFVPQEPILFHRTLMENIRYGRREASKEEVLEAARKAHCHEFISALKDGYNTYVGERGVRLSGGERQRVAIARAILKNAPILLLDEATSSLDSESEALIQDALSTLMQNKTVMVIAHRLSTIMKMDRIVVLQEGKIVAQGTHQELLSQGGLYQKLWSIQAGGFLGGDKDTEPPAEEKPPEEDPFDEEL